MAMASPLPAVLSSAPVRPQALFYQTFACLPVVWKTKSERHGSSKRASCRLQVQASSSVVKEASLDLVEWNKRVRNTRLEFLEAQALDALRKTIEGFERPTFPCALITGDVVILDLLHRLGALKDDTVKIVFIDTLHLFPETYEFLSTVEKRYGFKAHFFQAAGIANKQEYDEKFGSDLFIRRISERKTWTHSIRGLGIGSRRDVDEYDKICKVEPFGRALSTLQVDAMINGRRRDHGAERAHLELFESGNMAKVQPLAYWEFRDCWDYIEKYQLPYHPLHDEGYPSIGDVQSTITVPREQWFEYGGERSGRFQGFKNKDGSLKTECGIHSPGSTA